MVKSSEICVLEVWVRSERFGEGHMTCKPQKPGITTPKPRWTVEALVFSVPLHKICTIHAHHIYIYVYVCIQINM